MSFFTLGLFHLGKTEMNAQMSMESQLFIIHAQFLFGKQLGSSEVHGCGFLCALASVGHLLSNAVVVHLRLFRAFEKGTLTRRFG
jgi:hypothetical protein